MGCDLQGHMPDANKRRCDDEACQTLPNDRQRRPDHHENDARPHGFPGTDVIDESACLNREQHGQQGKDSDQDADFEGALT